MKNYLLYFSILLIASISNAQNIKVVFDDKLEMTDNISPREKTLVLERVSYIVEKYNKFGQFKNESDINAFSDLFDFSKDITVFNDLEVKPVKTALALMDYLDYVQSFLIKKGGHPFFIDGNVRIVKIRKNRKKNIIMTIKFVKVNKWKTNNRKELIKPSNGFNNDLTLVLITDPYTTNLDKTFIIRLFGKSEGSEISKIQSSIKSLALTSISVDGLYSRGLLLNTNEREIPSSQWSSYGAAISYSRTIGERAYFTTTISGEITSINTETKNINLNDYNIKLGTSEVESFVTSSDNSIINDKQEGTITSIDQSIKESLNITSLHAFLGFGYRLYSGVLHEKLVISLGPTISYLQTSGDGELTIGGTGLKIPNKHFPDPSKLNPEILKLYDQGIQKNLDIQPNSNISFGAQFSITYFKSITRIIGFEVGLDTQYSLTSIFDNTGHDEEKVLLKDRTNSILEDSATKNQMLRGIFRIGLFFQL